MLLDRAMNQALLRIQEVELASGRECFVSVESRSGLDLQTSLVDLLDRYHGALEDLGLGPDTEVRLRAHVSDIENQAPALSRALAERGAVSFVSWYGQAPLSGAKIALEAYHMDAPGLRKTALPGGGLELAHGAYRSRWMRCLPAHPGDSYAQTGQMFDALARTMGGTLADNLLRTWIYVRDIDNNYQGMVDARRELFADAGLVPRTHFVASTGIQGKHELPAHLVGMDALALFGHAPDQVRHLSAPGHLCPTHEYNVTFERGSAVCFGDRTHCYISGTASIDHLGQVLHAGDVARQTERTLDNMHALLADAGAGLSDLCSVVAYVRDSADAERVDRIMDQRGLGETPRVFVHGSVCRPAWLVEIEGIAVVRADHPEFSPFC